MHKNLLTRLTDNMHVDWFLFVPGFLISLAGLITMNSFSGENYFFFRQSIWLLVAVAVFFLATLVDWRFLRQTRVIVPIFLVVVSMLVLLSVTGHTARGAERWFRIGPVALQPFDLARIVIILMLAKYFSRRHIEIRNIRHILVSGFYAFIIFVLLLLQPDFSGGVVIAGLWFGMVLVSGISKKHLLSVIGIGLLSMVMLWTMILAPYQKARVVSFLDPLADVQGAGYNAYQSTIAVGSGEILGKGIGQGSQSKLLFLPEYETDFIFAAFTEEWGFVGAILLLSIFLFLLFRIISNAEMAPSNFESFFGMGIAILFFIHLSIHVGMNIGALPVTGITLSFMSYGGSHLLTDWLALGMLSSMKHHSHSRRLEA